MNKLLLSGVGALALFAVAGTGVSAWSIMSPQTNMAVVSNSVSVSSNTGSNDQSTYGRARTGGLVGFGSAAVTGQNSMVTGNAVSTSIVDNQLNNGCGCEEDWSIMSPTMNSATVMNGVGVAANSGDNSQTTRGRARTGGLVTTGNAGVSGQNILGTGAAQSQSTVWNIVNSSMFVQ